MNRIDFKAIYSERDLKKFSDWIGNRYRNENQCRFLYETYPDESSGEEFNLI